MLAEFHGGPIDGMRHNFDRAVSRPVELVIEDRAEYPPDDPRAVDSGKIEHVYTLHPDGRALYVEARRKHEVAHG